jgi:hexosaminidase
VCIDRPEEGPNAGVSEEYSLRVSGGGILISCSNKVGLAWALSTLMQLLTHWSASKTCVALIADKPLLSHRGVLLDVARNFVPLPDITLLLNTMSAVKLNVLHMHLTDDQVH